MNAQNHKFPLFIEGEFITLSKVMDVDAPFIYGIRTSEAAQYLNCPPNYSLESQLRWQSNRPSDEVNYIIYDKKEAKRVGMVAIYECDWSNRVSNVGRLLLQHNFVHKSTPYGLEALKMTYGYVFNTMCFRKIAGTVNTKNERTYRLQKFLGMNDEGCFRDHVLLKGEPQDLYFLSLFREDFTDYSNQIDKLLQKFRSL